MATIVGTSPGFLLRRAQRVHASLWHDAFAGDVTGPQYSCMVAIAGWPQSHQQTIGMIIGLDKATTGGIVDRLAQRDLVRRGVDPSDMRRHVLHLTDAGREAMPDFAERGTSVHRALVGLLPHGAEIEFIDLIGTVAYRPGHVRDVPVVADPGYAVMDLSTSIGHLLRRTHQRYQAQWNATFGGRITIAQYAVLAAGHALEDADQQRVSEQAGLDPSSAAAVLMRMETEGWLSRGPDAHDRRRRVLNFSPAARLAAEWAAIGVERVDERVFDELGTARRDRLKELLWYLANGNPHRGETVHSVE